MQRWSRQSPALVAIVLVGMWVSACGGGQPYDEAIVTGLPEDSRATSAPADTPTPTANPLPDLVISSSEVDIPGYTGTCVTEFVPLIAEVCVKNQGGGDAGPFVVRAQLYGLGAMEWEVEGLALGEELCLEDESDVNGRVRVDPDNAVAESDETNNIFTVLIPTQPPICTPVPIETLPARATATPYPEGSKVTTEVIDVYNCRYLGGTTFEWYKAEVTYVDGVLVEEEILDGPFISREWRGGCPQGED